MIKAFRLGNADITLCEEVFSVSFSAHAPVSSPSSATSDFTSSHSLYQPVDRSSRSLHRIADFFSTSTLIELRLTLLSSQLPTMPSYAQIAAFAAATAPALVSAHGYVSGVVSGGQWYSGTSPQWTYEATKPETAGWYANNQDNGYVEPASFADPDIIWYASIATTVIITVC